MKLYEIHDAIEKILAREVDPETGEISEAAAAKLDGLEMDLQSKSLELARYYKGEKAEAMAVASEAQRLAERAKRHLRRAEWIKNYLEQCGLQGQKLKDANTQIFWRENTFTECVDESLTPKEFLETRIEVLRGRILQSLRKGQEVRGWKLGSRKSILIR